MSEERELLSKRALMIIGIISLVILVLGIILYYTGLNEAFYSESGQTFFKIISYLGEPVVFILVGAVLYLGYNKSYAKNLTLNLLISYYFNGLIKELGQDPRPSTNQDPLEDLGVTEASYGFPSGHAQNAVTYWGYVSYEFKDNYKKNNIPIIPIILSVIIFLVAISRIIIGVHDLQDIIGGLLLGIGFLLLFIYVEPSASKLFNKLNFIGKIILTIIVSLVMFLIPTFIFPNAGVGEALVPTPIYPDAGVFGQVGGAILGFGVGYLLEQKYVQYDPSQLSTKKKIINILIGIVIIFVVFLPFEYLLTVDSVFYRFFRYTLITAVIALLIPFICTKINK